MHPEVIKAINKVLIELDKKQERNWPTDEQWEKWNKEAIERKKRWNDSFANDGFMLW